MEGTAAPNMMSAATAQIMDWQMREGLCSMTRSPEEL
jgi:hypothetical protein